MGMGGGLVWVNGKQVHSLVLGPLEEGEYAMLWTLLVWHNCPAEQRL